MNDAGQVFQNVPALGEFLPASNEEILKLILSSPAKSCSLDPIPTWILKKHSELLAPCITAIINLSMQTYVFPESFKLAIVSPLLKRSSLSIDNLANFRPVANLKFLSKILEKVVASRILSHFSEHNLLEPYQSAYRKGYSVETALVRVSNDIHHALDKKKAVFLVLLDLSAAFDTVDHSILLRRLETCGVTGGPLEWFKSYLENRKFVVRVGDIKSSTAQFDCGVPQGSVLGPILFSIYVAPLADIAKQHGISAHFYADDTQLYVPFDPNDHDSEISARVRLEACIVDMANWMITNKLKLNDCKSEFLIISSKFHKNLIHTSSIVIGQEQISNSSSVRNLGVTFDDSMSMEAHVRNICKSMYYNLHNVSCIRKVLNDRSAAMLIHAFVVSRLDTCNPLLYNLPARLTNKLQLALNAAARVLTMTSKYDHITPILENLHWLPIAQRIQYKILLLTWKILHKMAPTYMQELLQSYIPQRSLRSSSKSLLCVPKTRVSYGNRAFSVAAPVLWNALPLSLKSIDSLETFKTHLKTHLFNTAFSN